MARIPDDEIERLKREVPIERLAKAAGIELRKHGSDLIGRCPFHDDRETSAPATRVCAPVVAHSVTPLVAGSNEPVPVQGVAL